MKTNLIFCILMGPNILPLDICTAKMYKCRICLTSYVKVVKRWNIGILYLYEHTKFGLFPLISYLNMYLWLIERGALYIYNISLCMLLFFYLWGECCEAKMTAYPILIFILLVSLCFKYSILRYRWNELSVPFIHTYILTYLNQSAS